MVMADGDGMSIHSFPCRCCLWPLLEGERGGASIITSLPVDTCRHGWPDLGHLTYILSFLGVSFMVYGGLHLVRYGREFVRDYLSCKVPYGTFGGWLAGWVAGIGRNGKLHLFSRCLYLFCRGRRMGSLLSGIVAGLAYEGVYLGVEVMPELR